MCNRPGLLSTQQCVSKIQPCSCSCRLSILTAVCSVHQGVSSPQLIGCSGIELLTVFFSLLQTSYKEHCYC